MTRSSRGMIQIMRTLLLGLDIGTTSIKAVVYNPALGKVTCTANRPTPVHHPRDGWSEHDPQELWQAVLAVIREAASGKPVAGLAISSMAETGVLIDRDGQPTAPIIAWYDRRTEPQAAALEARMTIDQLYRITGQRASPSFGVTKLLWMRENQPEAYRRGAAWLPVPAYILWRLTGQKMVDYTIAARTLLFDQQSLSWSGELLSALDLPEALLPHAAVGGTPVGTLTQAAANQTGLSASTICALGGHDHLCAALAAGATATGSVVDSTGSANALLFLLPNFLPDPAQAERGFACYAYLLKDLYILKGGLKAAGSAVEWLARHLSAGPTQPDYAALEAAARLGVARRAGPVWLPHLIGSGTPQGDRFSRAAMVGAQIEHQPGDLYRGMLESLAFWLRQNLEEMQSLTQQQVDTVNLIGGVTRITLLSQLKADILNRPVHIPQITEAAATGAALLAGLGTGIFETPDQAVASLRYNSTILDPDPGHTAWYEAVYQRVYLPLYQALKTVNHSLQDIEQSEIFHTSRL
jgi:xylulokinase